MASFLDPLVDPATRAFYAGRPVLVTGGAGFVGSNIVHALVSLGAEVTVVDNFAKGCGGTRANLSELIDRVSLEVVDQADSAALVALAPRFDAVFNLAGRVSHVDSMAEPFADLHTNVTAQLGLLEAFRRGNPKAKIVFAGSRSQYGRSDGRPTAETAALFPVDVNGVNKQAGEQHHFVYASAFGLRATSLRLTNTYGERMTLRSPANGVLPWFVRQALEDHELHLYGGGHQRRDCVFVADVVAAFLLAMASPSADGHVFNIGGETVSLIEAAEAVVAAAGRGRVVDHPYPPEHKLVEVGDFVADCAKARTLLCWAPRTSIADGMRAAVAFYRARGLAAWTATSPT